MKHLRIFRDYSSNLDFDEISKNQYEKYKENSSSDNYKNGLYIELKKVLQFKSNLPYDNQKLDKDAHNSITSQKYRILYAPTEDKTQVAWMRGEFDSGPIDESIPFNKIPKTKEGMFGKSFSIHKVQRGSDVEFYILRYHLNRYFLLDSEDIDKKFYFRFEESDFDMICKNPKKLFDFLDSL